MCDDRYRGYRNPPGGDDEYEYTRQFYLIFTARLAVVIVFEVRVTSSCCSFVVTFLSSDFNFDSVRHTCTYMYNIVTNDALL